MTYEQENNNVSCHTRLLLLFEIDLCDCRIIDWNDANFGLRPKEKCITITTSAGEFHNRQLTISELSFKRRTHV